jgi:leucyl/phenylalanyl-tRNA--protein transferase
MFPPVETADEDGFLCWGGNLDVATLRQAYHSGIFPWPYDDAPLFWFAPPQRTLLFFDELHVGSRLRRYLKKSPFEVRVDTQFEAVMQGCAGPRSDGEGTWIIPKMIQAYTRLHHVGDAHSVEAWQDGELVGGLYGVSYGTYFCGESMFTTVDNASKAALVWLVEHMRNRGATWIDCQMMTPHFQAFGARDVERSEFMELLKVSLSSEVELFPI